MPEGAGPPLVFLEAELSLPSELEEITTQVTLESHPEPMESESELDLNMDQGDEDFDDTIFENETIDESSDLVFDPNSGDQSKPDASSPVDETAPAEKESNAEDEEPASQPTKAATPSDKKENDTAEFFGTRVNGKSFVYVLDRSGSMSSAVSGAHVSRLEAATRELLHSIEQLGDDQYFYVILFSSEMLRMFEDKSLYPKLIKATKQNKRKLRNWLEKIDPAGSTDPRDAIDLAIRLKPNAIFMLSDGAFNTLSNNEYSAISIVKNQRGRKIPVNTIAFQDRSASQNLAELATASNGTFRFVGLNNQLVSASHLVQMASNNSMSWSKRYDLAIKTAIPLLTAKYSEQRETAHATLRKLSFDIYPKTDVDLSTIEIEQLVAIWKPIWVNTQRVYQLSNDQQFSAAEIAQIEPEHWFHLFQSGAFENELPHLNASQLPSASDPNLNLIRARLLLDYFNQHGSHPIVRGALLSCLNQLSPEPLRRTGSLFKKTDWNTWDKRYQKILQSRERAADKIYKAISRTSNSAVQETWAKRLIDEYPETKSAGRLREEMGN